MFNECVYVIKNAIDKFLPGFYGSHKVNLQNFTSMIELTKWFVFEAVQFRYYIVII